MTKKRVYCSGPLFSPEEIAGMSAIANVIEAQGYDTFVPHRDGLERYLMRPMNSPIGNAVIVKNTRGVFAKAIFSLDVFQIIESCDYFVMNLNGRVPDEGAVAEAGIAFSAGKPIVIHKNDNRTVFNGVDNAMVSCLATTKYANNVNEIPKLLNSAIAKMSSSPLYNYQDNMPENMRTTVEYGRKIWNLMQKFNLGKGEPKHNEKFINELINLYDIDSVES
jgi:nucleoside 2-deoxyribosyltransferase